MKSLRIVTQIYTERDERPPHSRPLASDIILSFWKYVIQQPVGWLDGIIFQTVTERSVVKARERVYRNLDRPLSDTLFIRKGQEGAEGREFRRLLDDTKFGKCARTITTEYIEMKEVRARVVQFQFEPQEQRHQNFHFVVKFEHR